MILKIDKAYIKIFILENISYFSLFIVILVDLEYLNEIFLWVGMLVCYTSNKYTRKLIREIKNKKSQKFILITFLSIFVVCGLFLFLFVKEASIFFLFFLFIPLIYFFNEIKGYPLYIKNGYTF